MKSALASYWQGLSPALQRYYRAAAQPSLLFIVLCVLHEWITRQSGFALPWRIVFALAPVLGLAWMFGAYLRFLGDCDELERRIELTALAWAAGIALHGAMACIFLLDAHLIDMPAKRLAACIALLLLGSYSVIRASLHRRYT